MIEIMRSTWAMALFVFAGLVLAVGKLLQVVAFAIVSGPDREGSFNDLVTAGAWLGAVAGAVAVVAIGSAVWTAVGQRHWREIWEVLAADVATFVIAVGLLVDAATSPGGSLGANIVAAVGFGGWAVLLTVKAAGRSLEERLHAGRPAVAVLWLTAAIGALLVAVGAGLPNASAEDKGLGLAAALLWMFGVAAIAMTLVVARQRRLIISRRFPEVIAGLCTLVAAYAAAAIVAGAVFGPLPSLTGVRAGVALATTFQVVAFTILAFAAWDRLRDLSLMSSGPPPFEAAQQSQCGHPLPPDAHFCPQCGAPAWPSATGGTAGPEPTTSATPVAPLTSATPVEPPTIGTPVKPTTEGSVVAPTAQREI